MSKFNSLSVTNVKGIKNKKFLFNFYPNKPCILVAPNGFGKSSIACGFKALNNKKIELKDDDFHNSDSTLIPELIVEFDSICFTANSTMNDISNNFDCCVINSPILAKAKQIKFGGFMQWGTMLHYEPEGELKESSTIKDFLIVRQEGTREVKRKQVFYNLDAIISVGYRIKSH